MTIWDYAIILHNLTKILKFKFSRIPGVFELALDRFPKFITKGLIF